MIVMFMKTQFLLNDFQNFVTIMNNKLSQLLTITKVNIRCMKKIESYSCFQIVSLLAYTDYRPFGLKAADHNIYDW